MCYAILPSSDELIIVKRDENGYHKCNSAPYREQNEMTATQNNQRLGVTPQQSAAMLGGSLFGWDAPAAKPESYDFCGKLIIIDKKMRIAYNQEKERNNEYEQC